jgi:nucleotidyltransferase/DNA polymerase involved in DNA repair
VVLTNNDGCLIACSQEAKDLGTKMGDPWFKIAKAVEQKVVRRSARTMSSSKFLGMQAKD